MGVDGLEQCSGAQSQDEARVQGGTEHLGGVLAAAGALEALQGAVGRLANRLQRRLMAQQSRSWEFDLEEGMLDPARLPRIIIDPQSLQNAISVKFSDIKITSIDAVPEIDFPDGQE